MAPHKLHLRRHRYGAATVPKKSADRAGRQADSQIPQNATSWSSASHMQVNPPSAPNARSPLKASTTGAITSRDVYLRARAPQRMPHLWPYTSCLTCAAHQTSPVATELTEQLWQDHRCLAALTLHSCNHTCASCPSGRGPLSTKSKLLHTDHTDWSP